MRLIFTMLKHWQKNMTTNSVVLCKVSVRMPAQIRTDLDELIVSCLQWSTNRSLEAGRVHVCSRVDTWQGIYFPLRLTNTICYNEMLLMFITFNWNSCLCIMIVSILFSSYDLIATCDNTVFHLCDLNMIETDM